MVNEDIPKDQSIVYRCFKSFISCNVYIDELDVFFVFFCSREIKYIVRREFTGKTEYRSWMGSFLVCKVYTTSIVLSHTHIIIIALYH